MKTQRLYNVYLLGCVYQRTHMLIDEDEDLKRKDGEDMKTFLQKGY